MTSLQYWYFVIQPFFWNTNLLNSMCFLCVVHCSLSFNTQAYIRFYSSWWRKHSLRREYFMSDPAKAFSEEHGSQASVSQKSIMVSLRSPWKLLIGSCSWLLGHASCSLIRPSVVHSFLPVAATFVTKVAATVRMECTRGTNQGARGLTQKPGTLTNKQAPWWPEKDHDALKLWHTDLWAMFFYRSLYR